MSVTAHLAQDLLCGLRRRVAAGSAAGLSGPESGITAAQNGFALGDMALLNVTFLLHGLIRPSSTGMLIVAQLEGGVLSFAFLWARALTSGQPFGCA